MLYVSTFNTEYRPVWCTADDSTVLRRQKTTRFCSQTHECQVFNRGQR